MQTDATLTTGLYNAVAKLEKNKKQVTWVVGLVIVGVLVGWFFVYNKKQKEINASEALASVSAPQPGRGLARSENAEAYLKVAANYPQSSASARALLFAAASLFSEGKYAEAKTQFEKFNREHRESPFVGQAQLGIAACLDAQGKTEEAATAYKNLIDRRPSDNVIPQAKFALGRIYDQLNKPEQAKTLFEDILRNDPYGSIGSEAGIRLEELREKHPALFAPPPTPPVATDAVINPLTITNTATNIVPLNPEKP